MKRFAIAIIAANEIAGVLLAGPLALGAWVALPHQFAEVGRVWAPIPRAVFLLAAHRLGFHL